MGFVTKLQGLGASLDFSEKSPSGKHRICIALSQGPELIKIKSFLAETGVVLSEFQNGSELLRELDRLNPFCLLYDSDISDVSPLSVMDFVSRRRPTIPVIFVGSAPGVSVIVRVLKMGAISFLEKPIDEGDLLNALKEAQRRHDEAWKSANKFERIGECVKRLTQREQEVFELVVTGMLNKQIASRLGISEKTVKVHRGRVMRKLEVNSIADLVRLSDQLVEFKAEMTPLVVPVIMKEDKPPMTRRITNKMVAA